MKFLLAFFLLINVPLFAQESAEDYAKRIYNLIITGDTRLSEEFVDLNQYTAFIDRLERLAPEEKEDIKINAAKTYVEVRRDFNKECVRIIKLYKSNLTDGVTFTYLNSDYLPSKNIHEIGMMSCFYIANIPEEEEPLEDAIRFECIKTQNGWRILDGFFDDPVIN